MTIKSFLLSLFFTGCSTAAIAQICPCPTPTPAAAIIPMPTTRPTVLIPAGVNLATYAFASNTIYRLAPGVVYSVNGTIHMKAANVSLNLNGSALSMIATLNWPENIEVRGSGFEIYNGVVSKAQDFIRAYAPNAFIHDIVIPDHASMQCVFGDAGSNNMKIQNLSCGITDTVSLFWLSNGLTVLNSTFAGSLGEDTLRMDTNLDNPVNRPIGALISGVTCSNLVNGWNKECIAIRESDGIVTIQNSTVNGYIRAGQSNATALGSNVTSLVISNVKFPIAHYPEISIKQGVVATISNSTFSTTPAILNIAVDSGSTNNASAILTNNTRLVTSLALKQQPFWQSISKPLPKVVETGTALKVE